jgi:23S rRNA pseudouridine1911/1915/1917 synthase
MLKILYEDDALIFIDKQEGIVVQRGYDPDEGVLLEQVAEYLRPRNERAFLMQRLDRGTSGVIFFTKQDRFNANITRQFERKDISKTYLALAEGRLEQHQVIDAPLARIGPISFGVRPGGKQSVTEVTPLAVTDNASFVQVQLMTGRTHQIRVHLAAIGHPLVGDWLYGRRNATRPMLHAYSLRMRHPRDSTPLRVTSEVPEDFVAQAAQAGLTDLGRYLAKQPV